MGRPASGSGGSLDRRPAAVGPGPDRPGAERRPARLRPARSGSAGPKVRRGDVRAAILDVLAVGADERLPDHPADRRAQRRRLEAEPRLGLPDRAAARGRGPRRGPRGRGPPAAARSPTRAARYVEEHPDELAATWRAVRRRPPTPRTTAPGPEAGHRPGDGRGVADRRRPAPRSSRPRPPRSSPTPGAGSTACSPRATRRRTPSESSRPGPELRIGDAEREAAVTALGEHYAAGRLTKDEYDERPRGLGRADGLRAVAAVRRPAAVRGAPAAGGGRRRRRGAAGRGHPAAGAPAPGCDPRCWLVRRAGRAHASCRCSCWLLRRRGRLVRSARQLGLRATRGRGRSTSDGDSEQRERPGRAGELLVAAPTARASSSAG